MGIFDWLGGTKRPEAGVARQPAAVLRDRLLGINRPTAPFVIRDGSPEGVDLVAEWKIVDAQWYEIFAAAGLDKVFRVLMKFDESSGEVRSVDQEWTVEWRMGIPSLSLSAEAFRGQKAEISFGTAYAFTEDLSFGQVYKYYFRTKEIKVPLTDATLQSGWVWKGVAFGAL